MDQFLYSLPSTLQYLSISVPGSFDEVAAWVSMMSACTDAEVGRGRYRSERVKQMDEGVRKGEELVARANPTARQTPPRTSPDARFTSATCYYCSEKRHIAHYCARKRKDEPALQRRRRGKSWGA